MPIAYLILAHENPRHLERLVDALTTDSARFFVHIDRKSHIRAFASLANRPNVSFTHRRVAVHWSDFSMVEATLLLLAAALAHPVHSDRFVLLSGADYPIRSAASIEQFFAADPHGEFINSVAMPHAGKDKPLGRLRLYKHSASRPFLLTVPRRVLMRLRVIPRRRDYTRVLGDLAPHGGCQWWALSREACEYVQAFVQDNPAIVRFFRNTYFADEMFFQTILANSPFLERIRRGVTYVDWVARGDRHPATLEARHIDLFRSAREFIVEDAYGRGEQLFARKVPDPSEEMVAALDALIASKTALPGDEPAAR